jgi:hypothetical protein
LLDTTAVTPGQALLRLSELGARLVFTSNFDDLLEIAARTSLGKPARVISRDADIGLFSPDACNIVKLNGDLRVPETLVLARQDFESYRVARPELGNLFRVEAARSDLLYLGCSLRDPHFATLLAELRISMGGMGRCAYAVVFDADEGYLRDLARRDVRVLNFVGIPRADWDGELATLLASIAL